MSEPIDSKAQSILTILAALSARGLTGALRVQAEPGAEHGIELLFRAGKLIFATSTHPGERLAEFLVRRGVLSGEGAKAALYEARRTGKFFHGYLVDTQIVSQEALQDLLYQRTEELLDEILKAQDGHIVFQQMPESQLDAEAPGVDQELFGRLLKHRKLWPQLYQQFRDPGLVLRCQPGIEAAAAFQAMGDGERKLLRLLDGQRPVSKILERRKNRMDLMILLARFLDAGLLQPVGPEPQALEEAAPPAPTAPAASARPEAPQRQEEASPETPKFDLDMIPVLSSGMDIAQLSIMGLMMDDLFLVSQIDGKSSVRELGWVTRMPDEKVAQVLERLLRHGHVELKPRSAAPPPKAARIQAAPRQAAALAPPVPARPRTPVEHLEHLYQEGLGAYNEGRFGDAEALLRRVLSLNRRSAKARARLALVLLERTGQDRAAQTLAEEAMDEDPLLGQCLEAMGILKIRLGELADARRLLEKAVLLDKLNVPAGVRILKELKAHEPKKGDAPEDFWWKIHRHIKLQA